MSVHCTQTDNGGNTLDAPIGAEPLNYLHGLEQALAPVLTTDAYGETIAELIQTLDKIAFQDVDDIKPAMPFETHCHEDHARMIVVKNVEGDH